MAGSNGRGAEHPGGGEHDGQYARIQYRLRKLHLRILLSSTQLAAVRLGAPGYDDSVAGWHAATNGGPFFSGVTSIWNELSPYETEGTLFRTRFTLPSGAVASASLDFGVDDSVNGIYVNGHLVSGTSEGFQVLGSHTRTNLSVTPSWLVPGGTNVIAGYGYNGLRAVQAIRAAVRHDQRGIATW